jgi:hypothetical protein
MGLMPDTISTVARSLETPLYFKRKIVIGLVLLIIFVVTIEIWVANRTATFGEKINGLEATKYSLELENDYLKNQVAQKKSLNLNQKKSLNLGFGKTKNIEYIKTSPIALNSNKY